MAGQIGEILVYEQQHQIELATALGKRVSMSRFYEELGSGFEASPLNRDTLNIHPVNQVEPFRN
jgi:hypothetical protein